MRTILGFVLDLALLLVAALAALQLRDNLAPTSDDLLALLPYLAATALAAALVLPLSGLPRTIWRLSTMPDYTRAVVAVAAVVIGAVALTFAFNRLDGIARSIPILHGLLGIVLLVGARVALRLRHNHRQLRKSAIQPLTAVAERPIETVLVIGLNRLAETYLQSLQEFAPGRIKVAGLVGNRDRHVGRLVGEHTVLGVPEDLETIMRDLEVHGIVLDRIVVATRFKSLSEDARRALLRVERAGSIRLDFLNERLGFEDLAETRDAGSETGVRFAIPPEDLAKIARRPFWNVKRLIDVVAAAMLLIVVSPVMAIVALLIAIEIGSPVAFWQQRPGLGGVPFRLYKFRTMRGAHGADGHLLSDEERTSRLSNLLRRTRLDELPQLYSILIGDMSFVGPRPLLPRDQSAAHSARLLVRPGLTGWAQVVGGRVISADDKAALDVWYVKNAGFGLDLKILLKTVRMVLFGERVLDAYVKRAWRDLCAAGVVRNGQEPSFTREARSAA